MPKQVTFISIVLALAAFLLLGVVWGRRNSDGLSSEFRSSCALSMDRVIEGGQGDVYDYEGVEAVEEPPVTNLVLYQVEGDTITAPAYETVSSDLVDEQRDTSQQNEAWHLFTRLIPPQDRDLVKEFNVFTDGPENTLAAVDLTDVDSPYWKLEVDIADLDNRGELIFTLIHEYAHLLTLNQTQVDADEDVLNSPDDLGLQKEKAAACPGYYTGLGCSHPNSYIQAFYTRFWVDIESDWAVVDAMQYEPGGSLDYYNALFDFYQAHRDRFVSDYSVTHPTEDIAESFTHFVFSPKPAGETLREQKIRFFYEYPELVRMRESILSGTCELDK